MSIPAALKNDVPSGRARDEQDDESTMLERSYSLQRVHHQSHSSSYTLMGLTKDEIDPSKLLEHLNENCLPQSAQSLHL